MPFSSTEAKKDVTNERKLVSYKNALLPLICHFSSSTKSLL